MLTLDQNTLLRLAPNSLKDWLHSRCQFRLLHSLLQRLRLATPHCPEANDTVTEIIGKIAEVEASERETLRHILSVEQAYQAAKAARKLRRLDAHLQAGAPPSPPKQDYSYLAFMTLFFWRKSVDKA